VNGETIMTGDLNVSGAVSTGDLTATSISSTGPITATGNISTTGTGTITSAGALSAASILTSGTITSASLSTGTIIATGITATGISVPNGNAVTGSLSTGTITASGAVSTGALTSTSLSTGSITATGNFYLTQTYPITNNTQLGYSQTNTVTTPIMSNSLQNLVTVTIPSAGVWLVEGQFTSTASFNPLWYEISLSTTSSTIDNTRLIRNCTNGSNDAWSTSLTRVFVLWSSTTKIYLVGQSSSSATSNSNTITYTKIG
jgi:hypothetical protein